MTATDGIFITPLEPGDGIRLAVKDLFDTAGIRTTYGSAIFAEHVPAETAEAVRLLEAAGYVDAGKANLHEFAYGVTLAEPPLRHGAEPGGARTHRGRLERRARRRRSPQASPTRRSAPTRAARSGSPPPAAGSPASSRASGSCRSTASSRSRRASTTPARWRATSPAASSDGERARARLRRRAGRARGARGRRRLVRPRRPARARRASRRAAASFPRSRPVAFPEPDGTIAAVHARGGRRPPRALRRARPSCTARTSARRSSAASRSATPRPPRAAGGARRATERLALEALDGLDLLLTPTLAFVAPPADVDELAVARPLRPLHVPVQRARLAGARAPVRRRRGRPAGLDPDRRPAGRRRARARRRAGARSGARALALRS